MIDPIELTPEEYQEMSEKVERYYQEHKEGINHQMKRIKYPRWVRPIYTLFWKILRRCL